MVRTLLCSVFAIANNNKNISDSKSINALSRRNKFAQETATRRGLRAIDCVYIRFDEMFLVLRVR